MQFCIPFFQFSSLSWSKWVQKIAKKSQKNREKLRLLTKKNTKIWREKSQWHAENAVLLKKWPSKYALKIPLQNYTKNALFHPFFPIQLSKLIKMSTKRLQKFAKKIAKNRQKSRIFAKKSRKSDANNPNGIPGTRQKRLNKKNHENREKMT